jgi:hypothetical protein
MAGEQLHAKRGTAMVERYLEAEPGADSDRVGCCKGWLLLLLARDVCLKKGIK